MEEAIGLFEQTLADSVRVLGESLAAPLIPGLPPRRRQMNTAPSPLIRPVISRRRERPDVLRQPPEQQADLGQPLLGLPGPPGQTPHRPAQSAEPVPRLRAIPGQLVDPPRRLTINPLDLPGQIEYAPFDGQ